MKATLAIAILAVLALGASAVTYYDYYGNTQVFPDGYGKAFAVPTALYGSYYYQSSELGNCGSYYYRNGQKYCNNYAYSSPTYNVYYTSAYATPTPPTINIYHVGTPAPNPYQPVSQPTAYPTNYAVNYAAPLPSCTGRCVYETANTRITATPGGYWLGEPNYWYYEPYEGYSN